MSKRKISKNHHLNRKGVSRSPQRIRRGTDHHFRMIQTGLSILEAEGVVVPYGNPLVAVHPTKDELMMILPGIEGEHPFSRFLTQEWEDCFFAVGYTPRYVSDICEPGALMVIRRFKERPSEQFLGQMVATDWQGLVRP